MSNQLKSPFVLKCTCKIIMYKGGIYKDMTTTSCGVTMPILRIILILMLASFVGYTRYT